VLENRKMRRILGTTRKDVTEWWRKLRNYEFNNLYYSPNIIRVIKRRTMMGAMNSTHGEMKNAYIF
jgi:acyl-coenzyme A synthetase/AMP-(fatty) acid ligase